MKQILLAITLLVFGVFVACSKAVTPQNGNVNIAPASAVVNDKAESRATMERTNDYVVSEAPTPQVKSPLPPPTGFLNDYAKVIDEPTKVRLEMILNNLKQRANIEFAVVTVETTGDEDIFDYSLALARGWGVGAPPRNDGLLLLIAVKDRKWRMQVSRSLEVDMPNEEVSTLGKLMIEPFRAGKYGEGLTLCVEATIKRLSAQRGFKLDEVLNQSLQARHRS